jgi:hypothetical protein
MSINKAIENIFEGRLDEMRQNFSAALTSKAVDKLEERKIQIAENYFGQVDESDLPITKQKKKTYTYKHKTSGKEISAVEAPGKDWEKIDESIAALLAGTAAGGLASYAGMKSGAIPAGVEKAAKIASKLKKKLIRKKKK